MAHLPSSAESSSSPTQALLKRLRARGLSQAEIARRTRIPQPRISRWESGDVPTAADDVQKLMELETELARQPAAGAGQHSA